MDASPRCPTQPQPRGAGRQIAALALAVAWSPAALPAVPVLGAPQSSVAVQASAGNLAALDACGDTVNGIAAASYGCTIGSGITAVTAGAYAGFGAVHGGVLAQGATSADTFGSSGQVNASFSDSFALRGPASTAAVLHGSFVIGGLLVVTVDGAAQAATAGQSSYSVQASLAGWNVASDGNVLKATNGALAVSNENGQTLQVDAPIFFDADGWAVLSISVLAQLHAEGTARAFQECSSCPSFPGDFRSQADFANTIYWGGISSVTVGGTPLASLDYLASASGVDYRLSTEFAGAPVPEPARLALAGAGLAVLAALRRRRAA